MTQFDSPSCTMLLRTAAAAAVVAVICFKWNHYKIEMRKLWVRLIKRLIRRARVLICFSLSWRSGYYSITATNSVSSHRVDVGQGPGDFIRSPTGLMAAVLAGEELVPTHNQAQCGMSSFHASSVSSSFFAIDAPRCTLLSHGKHKKYEELSAARGPSWSWWTAGVLFAAQNPPTGSTNTPWKCGESLTFILLFHIFTHPRGLQKMRMTSIYWEGQH